MRRICCMLLALVLLAGALCGCSGPEEASEGGLKVVVTIFPLYDWTKTLLGDSGSVTMLMDNGVDLHNYDPSAADIAAIQECDLLIYVGGESDAWVENLLQSNPEHRFRTLDLMQTLHSVLLEEEHKEGMQAEEEPEEEGALDEHIWLSLCVAERIVQAIAEELSSLDEARKGDYAARAGDYCAQLEALDRRCGELCASAARKTILVADRFPFRYFAADYGLDYYAAFPGCAAASDVSFETIDFLAEKLRQLRLPVLFVIDGSDGAIAETVLEAAGSDAQVRRLNSAQCVSADEISGGMSYLRLMEENLDALKEALN